MCRFPGWLPSLPPPAVIGGCYPAAHACLASPCRLPQVKETTHDIKFLHNEQFFAAAQKKYVYIYDKRGLEVHCLKVRPLGWWQAGGARSIA